MVRAVLFYVVFGSCLAGTRDSVAQDSLKLTVSGPMVPHKRVEYAVDVDHGTIVARYSAIAPKGFHDESRIGLVTAQEWSSLVSKLKALGVDEMESDSQLKHEVRYRLEWSRGKEIQVWTMDDPSRLEANSARAVISSIRQFVRDRAGHVPFWDNRLLDSEAGHLRVRSEPPGEIVIDGLSLNRVTPILGLKLMSGPHVIELIHPNTGAKWSYPVTIKAGRTTLLNVSLK